MKSKKLDIITANNPHELANVLGLFSSDVAEWEFRSNLNDKIIELVGKSNLTRAEVAKKAETARSRITALLNRSRTDFSRDFMVRVLSALGYKIDIKLGKISS